MERPVSDRSTLQEELEARAAAAGLALVAAVSEAPALVELQGLARQPSP